VRERASEQKTCTSNLNFFLYKNYGEIKKAAKDGKENETEKRTTKRGT
jgi:hypothetical protein